MAVPVIDLSGGTSQVVEEVGRACREIGFLTVVGHGVPDDVVAGTAEAAHAFFDLPDDEKLRLTRGEATPGLPVYRPLASESLAGSLGDKTPGDLKESLDWGPAVPGYGWPAQPAELRDRFEAYFEELGALGGRIRRFFALALELPEDWFEPFFRGHSSSIRAVNYPSPEGEAEPGQLRAGAHTDYGCMTILRTENAPGGLQVQTRAGEWLDVYAVPGSFVVNLGDMMARWTNDRWPATLHRVAVPPADAAGRSRRQTLVLFHDPRADAVIECVPSCTDADDPPRYGPITALDHVLEKAVLTH